jgi:hypothetical protein
LSAGPDRLSVGRATIGLLLVTAMFVGYSFVYVITPLPVEWQISTSFDRLLTQLWPALLWTVFQFAGAHPRSPDSGRRDRRTAEKNRSSGRN